MRRSTLTRTTTVLAATLALAPALALGGATGAASADPTSPGAMTTAGASSTQSPLATATAPDPTATTVVPSPTTAAPSPTTSTGPAPGEPTFDVPPPPPPTPTTRPLPTPRAASGEDVRAVVRCSGCVSPFVWVAGTGHVQVAGTVLPLRTGAVLSIQRMVPGATAYVQVGTATTDAAGRFTWTGPMAPVGTTRWQAVLGDRRSAVVTTTVSAPRITASAWHDADTAVNPPVRGVVTPSVPGIAVRTEILVGGRWLPDQRRTSWGGGAFSMPLTYGVGSVTRVTLRTATTLPGGTVVASAPITVDRIAVMRPTVRRTVAADVPRTYRAGCPVGPSRLSTIDMNHWGFDGKVHRGRLVIRDGNVTPILRSFQVGFDGRFPIREMRDASAYGGNDVISMEHDNTNAFNCRRVTGNPYRMSPHAYGTSVDINTVENPYRIPSGVWLPKNGAAYVARSPYRPGMLTSTTPLTRALRGNGFQWLSGFDWQHFQR